MSQVAAWRKIMLCRAAQLRAQGPSILPKAWAQGLLWQGRPPPLRDGGEAPLLLAFSELFFSTPCFETGSSVRNSSCFLRSARCKHCVSLVFLCLFSDADDYACFGLRFCFSKTQCFKNSGDWVKCWTSDSSMFVDTTGCHCSADSREQGKCPCTSAAGFASVDATVNFLSTLVKPSSRQLLGCRAFSPM